MSKRPPNISPRRRSRNRFQTIPSVALPRRDGPPTAPTEGPPVNPPNLFVAPESDANSTELHSQKTPSPPLSATVYPLPETLLENDAASLSQGTFEAELLDNRPFLSGDTFRDEPQNQISQDSDQDEARSAAEEGLLHRDYGTVGIPSPTDNASASSLLISSWRVIWGLLVTGGSVKMTKVMYQSMRSFVDTFSRLGHSAWKNEKMGNLPDASKNTRVSSLPHFSTLTRVFRPLLHNSLAPRALEYFERMDVTKAGARPSKYNDEGQAMAKVCVVHPSEYARADIATGPVFKAMRSTSLDANCSTNSPRANLQTCAITAEECVDVWPIVCARELFYGRAQTVSLDFCHTSSFNTRFAERGDRIQIELLGPDPLSSELLSSFPVQDGQYPGVQFEGVVLAVWTVHHSSRRQVPGFDIYPHDDLSARDRAIYDTLNFVSYTSPTDSIDIEIPDLPTCDDTPSDASDYGNETDRPLKRRRVSSQTGKAGHERRASFRKRQNQIQRAWRDWTKPLLKPGDVVALLSPRSFDSDSLQRCQFMDANESPRVCLVHRFWRENEERSRHILWIPADVVVPNVSRDQIDAVSRVCSCPNVSGSRQYRDVIRASMAQMHPKPRGVQRFKPVSSFGRLQNGDYYAIYRFLLFWDGFQISDGKSASGDGFYLLCLNLPLQARSSPQAVRIISLTPPGVKPGVVFKRIQRDIISGMTTGFMDTDAEGQQRRIFLDLVGVVGDTPALNGELDVLGHTSQFCCHLCTFSRRSSTLIGARYTRSGSHGTISHTSRRYHQHAAVRDSKPGAGTFKSLGMKHMQDESCLPLHLLRQAMWEAKKQIPVTSTGQKLLSGDLDPYRASFVAPDHLLSGHIRDCLNLAFRALPTPQHRMSCEAFLISLLTECGLPSQNRLYDHEKRKLFTMSMTELYALIVVAEHGFKYGSAHADAMASTSGPSSNHCRAEIFLLQSCSRLVAEFWYLPISARDGLDAVQSFDSNFGLDNVARLQSLTEEHLQLVEELCAMPDEDVCALEDLECGKRRRTVISKEHKARVQAIKIIDKPNLHRLRELVYTNLPMLGHVSRVGELILEKAHQTLKRGIRQSNNKEPHLQALKSNVLNDWQGRLSLLASRALSADLEAVLGCFRLLAGREAVWKCSGTLAPHHILHVRQAIGPEGCVPTQLRIQGISVISNVASGPSQLSWKIEGLAEHGCNRNTFSTARLRHIYDSVTRAFASQPLLGDVQIGDGIVSSSQKERRALRFQHGDVLETICIRPKDKAFHFPFVIPAACVRSEALINIPTGLCFWFAIAFIRCERFPGNQAYFAAVLPCKEVPCPMQRTLSTPRYTIMGQSMSPPSVSFLRVTPALRSAAAYHACTPPLCTVGSYRGTIQHSSDDSPLQGGSFYIKSRKEGYPPRQG